MSRQHFHPAETLRAAVNAALDPTQPCPDGYHVYLDNDVAMINYRGNYVCRVKLRTP